MSYYEIFYIGWASNILAVLVQVLIEGYFYAIKAKSLEETMLKARKQIGFDANPVVILNKIVSGAIPFAALLYAFIRLYGMIKYFKENPSDDYIDYLFSLKNHQTKHPNAISHYFPQYENDDNR